MKKVLTVFTDGGSRGNPGHAAAGVYIVTDGEELFRGGKYLGQTTNNIAEYNGLILALNWVNKHADNKSFSEVVFTLDSELIVRQLKKEYKVKDEKMKEMFAIVQTKLSQISIPYSFKHVKREQNKVADKLVNEILDKQAKS